MKNSKVLFQEILARLDPGEGPEENKAISYVLLEGLLGVSKVDIMTGKMIQYSQDTALTLQKSVDRIKQGEPVQYVVGKEIFFGRNFNVNPSVLIPRPETEELVRVVLTYIMEPQPKRIKSEPLRILDVGTGTGCIPITLFHEIGESEIFATDVSHAALSVAVDNARNLEAKITFMEHNVLKEKLPVRDLDVIVSNPPYVTERERSLMRSNVLEHEPPLALFVPDDDPLIFYVALVQQAIGTLKPGGLLAVEINVKFGAQVSALFIQHGFKDVQIVNDISSKPRIVRGLNAGLEI